MSDSPVVAPTQSTSAPAPFLQSRVAALANTLKAAWQPKPVPLPHVDPDLTEFPAIERSAEVFRYKLLQLEYALSPGGALRAWLKMNLLVCLILGIPALLVVPVITFLIGSFATWTVYLYQATLNVLYTLLTLVAIVGVVLALVFLVSAFLRNAMNQRR
jgi:hypothetical protein